METFLDIVARDLMERMDGDFRRTAVVFPNKRARLFFNDALGALSGKPLWSPAYLSISGLFGEMSGLKEGDPIKLVCDLYKVFREATGSTETLDDFYSWGELLVADFDDVDKNMVDARRLFANLADLKELMGDCDFLTPEQAAAVQQFFGNFSLERRTELKERFMSLWNVLGDIYVRYREVLSAQGVAYEGMLCRRAVERLDASSLPYDTYVFVGFNVLNKVEHTLFSTLRDAGKALFYWDYDTFYVEAQGHEAGEFLRRNLKDFPSPLPSSCFRNLSRPKDVHFVAASTENAQARCLPSWIREHLGQREQETAVVLCNESLLQPVMHSIPPEVKNVNITMGFPLLQTPVCGFLSALADMQGSYDARNGRLACKPVAALLKHPYMQRLSSQAAVLAEELARANRFYPLPSELKRDGILEQVFTIMDGNLALCDYFLRMLEEVSGVCREDNAASSGSLGPLYREALFKAYTVVSRLRSLVEEGGLEVSFLTFRRLLGKVLSSQSVPFHGEPAIGLQVMGVLETRNLDFRHVALLSVNEGQLPKSGSDTSFIPYNLRKAFGMTTIERKNAVYAYYFYRLLQRAESVTLMYNAAGKGLNRGEQSRFLLQFLLEYPHPVAREYVDAGQSPSVPLPVVVDKTPGIMNRMQELYDADRNEKALLTPSALNAYLDCPVKFYFRYVLSLRPLNEASMEIDSAMFGSIFHRSAELVYRDLTVHGKVVRKEDLEALLRDKVRLQGYVDTAFKELFFKVGAEEQPEYNGVQLINSSVILSYLCQLLRHDLRYAPFEMEAMEHPVRYDVGIPTVSGIIHSRIGGVIDRLDLKDGLLRIVDYKTGGSPKAFSELKDLFAPSDDRPSYVFQTFLYAFVLQQTRSCTIAPSLLYIHRAASESYSPVICQKEGRGKEIPVDDFSKFQEEFGRLLSQLLRDIFDESKPFVQASSVKRCVYCDFKDLCRR